MKIPFVSFIPLEKELDKELRDAFERVYTRSWYIEGEEDKAFEKAFADYCGVKYAVGSGNGLDALMLALKALGSKKVMRSSFLPIHILQRLSQLHMSEQHRYLLSRTSKHLISILR